MDKRARATGVRIVIVTAVLIATSFPALAGKTVAEQPVPAVGVFRCPTGDCAAPATEGLTGDGLGTYVGTCLDGVRVGTWVGGTHDANFMVGWGWTIDSGARFLDVNLGFPLPPAENIGLVRTRFVKFDIDLVKSSRLDPDTLLNMKQSVPQRAQATLVIYDGTLNGTDGDWQVVFNGTSSYLTATRTGDFTWTIRAEASDRARVYWQPNKSKIDKGLYYVPFELTITLPQPAVSCTP